MIYFNSDYMEGAHPSVLEAILRTNSEHNPGYGTDGHCAAAAEKIRDACGCPAAQVHFLVGGTQTNATVIDALLRSYQGVVSADSGHINVHESGAIESSGHKVIALPGAQGKLGAEQLRRYFADYYADGNAEHMVAPGAVYISHPTEYGTLYSRDELEQINAVCHEYAAPLFLDGARLACGLAADGADVTLGVIAKNCDVFYIGGTKCGALFGEAVVFTRPELAAHFFSIVKQHGALLAKGWLTGVQFDALFTDGLYLELGCHAVSLAQKMKRAFIEKGYRLYLDNPTNQVFVVLENGQMDDLGREIGFNFFEKLDEAHTVVRLATSWATDEKDVDRLISLI